MIGILETNHRTVQAFDYYNYRGIKKALKDDYVTHISFSVLRCTYLSAIMQMQAWH